MDNNTNKSENISLIIIIVVIVIVISAASAWFFTYKKSKNHENVPVIVKTEVSKSDEDKIPLKAIEPEKTQYQLDVEKFYSFFPDSFFENYLKNSKSNYNLSFFKRAVKYGFQGDYLADLPGVSWENLEKTKNEAFTLGRKLMSNPDFLKSLYFKIKPLIVGQITKAKSKEKTVNELKKAIKFFKEEIKGKALYLFEKHYESDRMLYKEIQKRQYNKEIMSKLSSESDSYLNKLKARGYSDDDVYFYQFTMRRKSEGNKEVLDAYVLVIDDLIESLSKSTIENK